jgi:hypothetical protein
VSRSFGWQPVAPGAVLGCPVRQPVHTGPIPESCSGQGSGAAPVHALGWPVHRPAAPGIFRKIDQDPPSMTLNYEEIVRWFQGLVQGNAGAWLMAPEDSLCVVNDQLVGNPKRKV